MVEGAGRSWWGFLRGAVVQGVTSHEPLLGKQQATVRHRARPGLARAARLASGRRSGACREGQRRALFRGGFFLRDKLVCIKQQRVWLLLRAFAGHGRGFVMRRCGGSGVVVTTPHVHGNH